MALYKPISCIFDANNVLPVPDFGDCKELNEVESLETPGLKKIKYNTHPPLKLKNYMLLLFLSSVHVRVFSRLSFYFLDINLMLSNHHQFV